MARDLSAAVRSMAAASWREAVRPSPRWTLAETAGRLVELSGRGASAPLTLAFDLVLDAQRRAEPAAWITPRDHAFYPVDAAECGVDLDALIVVRVASAREAGRAADHLLRSGAFGLAVLDLGRDAALPLPLQTRLLGLAQKHRATLLCLTEKAEETPSLGSLVSLRAQARRARVPDGSFVCSLLIQKDKRRGPTWSHAEVYRGPAGLC